VVPILAMLALPAASAMTWRDGNKPNTDTLVLYHMDGTEDQLLDAGPQKNHARLNTPLMRSPEPGTWQKLPVKHFLNQPAYKDEALADKIHLQNIKPNQGVTVSAWIRQRKNEIPEGTLFWLEGPAATPRVHVQVFGNDQSGGSVTMWFPPTGTNVVRLAPGWHHVAVIFDPQDGDATNGGQWRFYVDNLLASEYAETRDLSKFTQAEVGIGRGVYEGGRMGGIDYDEFLVQNEVIADFSNGYGTPGSLPVRQLKRAAPPRTPNRAP
jgi:hypothetical protein